VIGYCDAAAAAAAAVAEGDAVTLQVA